jgi:hypothetical protein
MLLDEIKKILSEFPGELEEKDGLYSFEFVVAERKAFLTKKKLTYKAKFRIDDIAKEVKFNEMLKESGFGLSAGGGMDDMTPGFGFKKEVYKSGMEGRSGTIEEQSNLFGEKYEYKFDYAKIRKAIEEKAQEAGYKFDYNITGVGL